MSDPSEYIVFLRKNIEGLQLSNADYWPPEVTNVTVLPKTDMEARLDTLMESFDSVADGVIRAKIKLMDKGIDEERAEKLAISLFEKAMEVGVVTHQQREAQNRAQRRAGSGYRR